MADKGAKKPIVVVADDDVEILALRLAVEETSGQRGVYHYERASDTDATESP